MLGIFHMLTRSRDVGADAKVQSAGVKMDKAAALALNGLAGLFILVFAASIALTQTNKSLVVDGQRIEVNGCASARPFLSVFDKSQMTAAHRIERGRHAIYHVLILKQKGQRTVDIRLGDNATDEKLTPVFPKAMQDYAEALRREGRPVAFDVP
ncbi:hypothetical protein CYK37_15010 [Mesorhizobium loti]|nr:hypothetical protein [Mesorhizobium loti]PLP58224.1 hypothetical protein CYK37_15010 [Mesorhizobium loti]